jgi:ribosome-binding protein aMBF1 (putative translation factor)
MSNQIVLQRPKSKKRPKLVGMFHNFEQPYANLIKAARRRKGLTQNEYLQALITVGDKLIPGIKITVRRVPKL